MKQDVISPGVAAAAPRDLCALEFSNRFVRELPGDPDTRNVSRAVSDACYTRVDPTPVPAPRLLGWSDTVAATLGIARPLDACGPAAEALTGNRVLPGMQPYAARYGGQQFGQWAGQLGDGRAITLGEVINAAGRSYELQLKGAGPTPYSRRADGRAVLRSSVREFMCSEAMHDLGVPTTRALSLTATGAAVVRDLFYDGNPAPEPGAVVCRVAPSFVRFGNFQLHAAQGEGALLKRLADHVIAAHFPELLQDGGTPAAIYGRWFQEICRRTALMVNDWMRVGFVHGVMNTDNMSILGLTVDYGPYGWLEGYDPQWTPNTTDASGRRYCYANQPQIAQWNLWQLANALYGLTEDKAPLEEGLVLFADTYESAWQKTLAAKLGFAAGSTVDAGLSAGLFSLLEAAETDYTLFFRLLATVPVDDNAAALDDHALVAPLQPAFYDEGAVSTTHRKRVATWLRDYIAHTQREATPPAQRIARMNAVNPKYVLRNYLAHLAIEALAAGDASVMERTMRVLQRPYDEQPGCDDLAARRPEWARHKAGCSALSCSS